MVQNQWYHFGIGAPPILVCFSGDWDVHWGYGVWTHDHSTFVKPPEMCGVRVRWGTLFRRTLSSATAEAGDQKLVAALSLEVEPPASQFRFGSCTLTKREPRNNIAGLMLLEEQPQSARLIILGSTFCGGPKYRSLSIRVRVCVCVCVCVLPGQTQC